MSLRPTRRQLLAFPFIAGLSPPKSLAKYTEGGMAWSLPIRNEGGVPADGFFMHYGYASENTKNHPGWWHVAEDWHRDEGVDTAGAEVLAVHAGEVVFVGSDYPGRVILVRHARDLYSMYAHIDYDVVVAEGEWVAAGQVIGRVLDGRSEWHATNHLHFEIRDFLYNPIVNGDMPKYGVKCGYRCPPGPGYWPIGDSRHPSEVGWRNPTHVIQRGFGTKGMLSTALVSTGANRQAVPVHETPHDDASQVAEVELTAGDRLHVVAVDVGEPASLETSALGYRVWYKIAWSAVDIGWVRAIAPDDYAVGSDGRPTGVRPILLPVSPLS